METRLTPAQAAGILEITKRTLRRWSNAFESSLSEPARRHGRKRFYSGEDIATLERAQQYIAEGMSLAEVAEQLPVITPDDKPTALILAPEVHAAIISVSDRQDDMQAQLEYLLAREKWRTLSWWERRKTDQPKPPDQGITGFR